MALNGTRIQSSSFPVIGQSHLPPPRMTRGSLASVICSRLVGMPPFFIDQALIARAYCFIRKIVCRSRSRAMIIDHCSGTVYAITMAMIVRSTRSAARVKPSCPVGSLRLAVGSGRAGEGFFPCQLPTANRQLQIDVRNMIERLARRLALHVDDAGLAGGLRI